MSYTVDELRALINSPVVEHKVIHQQLLDWQEHHTQELQKVNTLLHYSSTVGQRKHKLELIFSP